MHLRHANHATLGTGPTLYKRVGSVIPRLFRYTTLANIVVVFYSVIKLHEFIDSYHYIAVPWEKAVSHIDVILRKWDKRVCRFLGNFIRINGINFDILYV